MTTKQFNIRVYGLLIHPEKGILISEERYQGHHFTKFPGGGLEWGEGPAETVRRELREELDLDVSHAEHFYTADFFVQSAFRESDQVLSIYYRITPMNWADLNDVEERENTDEPGRTQKFHWVPMGELTMESVRFPTDRRVVDLLMRSGI
jgi:8-oxo-dGTP diphosphatase